MIRNEFWQVLINWPIGGQPSFWLSFARDPLKSAKTKPAVQCEFQDGHVTYKVFWWGETVEERILRGWAREVRSQVLKANLKRES